MFIRFTKSECDYLNTARKRGYWELKEGHREVLTTVIIN